MGEAESTTSVRRLSDTCCPGDCRDGSDIQQELRKHAIRVCTAEVVSKFRELCVDCEIASDFAERSRYFCEGSTVQGKLSMSSPMSMVFAIVGGSHKLWLGFFSSFTT